MRIVGTASELPKLVVKNDDLASFLDTSDEWIQSRTGIMERRVLSDEKLEDLAVSAAGRALERAGMQAAQLDLILCSNVMGSYITPGLSCIIQGKIQASCPCLDLNAACAGFIYALDVADAYIASGKATNILIVCAEAITHMIDWQDRATCVLFGDGVGAVVVTKGSGLISMQLSAASDTDVLYARQVPGNSPYSKDPLAATPLYMNGQDVYKFAVSVSVSDLKAVMEKAGLQPGDIKYFLLHQANMRILEAARQRLEQPKEKFPHNLDRLGNTSSASIPILLDELNSQGLLQPGDLLAMSAFGAGLVSGACVVQWK